MNAVDDTSRAPARRRGRPPRRYDVAEDVEWLLAGGETHPDAIATRLGYRTRGGLRAALKRAGREDLADAIAERSQPEPTTH